MQRTIKAKYTQGHIVPFEELDIKEGEEVLVALEESTHDISKAEDTALSRAITEGLESREVGRGEVFRILREPDPTR